LRPPGHMFDVKRNQELSQLQDRIRQLEKQLAENECVAKSGLDGLSRQVFESLPDAIIILDAEAEQFIDANDAALRLYGYSRGEFLNLNQSDVAADLKNSQHSFSDHLDGKSSTTPLRYHKKKDGTEFPVEMSISQIESSGRALFCGSVRDISERKRTEMASQDNKRWAQDPTQTQSQLTTNPELPRHPPEQESLKKEHEQFGSNFQTYCGAYSDLHFHIDRDGTIVDFHASDKNDIQWQTEKFLGKRLRDLMPSTIVHKYDRGIRTALESDSTVTFQHKLSLRDGDAICEGRIIPSLPDEVNVIVRNITDDKETNTVIQSLAEGTANTTGDDFFPLFARSLAGIFSSRYVLVCEHLDSPATRAKTKAFWMSDRLGESLEYELAGGPCEEPASGEMTFYPEGLQELFPEDTDLVDLEAESYCGIPLISSTDQLIGHLAIMDDRPMDINICDDPVLQVFVARVTAELERSQIEKTLRESEQRLKSIIGAAPIVITSVDEGGEITFFDGLGVEAVGLRPNQFVGHNYFEIWKDSPHLTKAMHECFEGKTTAPTTTHVGGTVLETRFSGMRSDNGRTHAVTTVCVDITDRLRIEEAVRESELRFRSLFEQAGVALGLVDTKSGRFLRVNRKYETLLGFSSEELLKKTWMDITHPDDLQKHSNLNKQIAKGDLFEFTVEKRLVHKDSSSIWINLTVTSIRNENDSPDQHIAIVQDITARKLIEQELRRNESRLKSIINAAPIVITHVDLEGKIGLFDGNALKDVGLESGNLVGHNYFEVWNDRPSMTSAMKACLAGEAFASTSMEIAGRSLETRYAPVTSPDGDIAGAISVCVDMTDHRKTQNALVESEQRLRIVTDSLPAFISYLDSKRCYQFVNKHYEDRFGIEQEKIIGSFAWEILGNTYYQSIEHHLDEVLDGNHVKYESMMRLEGQGKRTLVTEHVPDTTPDGEVRGFYTLVTDISDRKHAEESLAQMNIALSNAMPGISRLDSDGHYVYANEAYAAMTGYEDNELVGQSWTPTVHPDDQPLLLEAYKYMLEVGKAEAEARGIRKDGSIYYKHVLLVKIEEDGKLAGHFCFMRDISDRKQAEHAIEQSQRLLQEAEHVAHLGSWEWDIARDRVTWSEELYNIFGYEPGAFEPSVATFLEHVDQADRRQLQDAIEALVESHTPFEIDTHILRRDGTSRTLRSIGQVQNGEDSSSRRVSGVCQDVTEIREREQALRLTQFSVDHANDAVIWIRSDGHFIYVNDSACRALGYSREELLKLTVPDIDPDFPASEWQSKWIETRKRGSVTLVCRHRRKDGSVFPVEIVTSFVSFGGDEFQCAYIRDITDRKAMEEQALRHSHELAHVSRISTMGEMATALAHELNQPLSAVANYAFALDQGLKHYEGIALNAQESSDLLGKIKTQAVRAGDIVRRMREFLRKVESQRILSDVNEIVNEVVALVEAEARERSVQIRLDLDNELPGIRIDSIRIQQVLVNLIRNAFDAMNETQPDDRWVLVSTLRQHERFIAVSVSDCGCGIESTAVEEVFDTFFTTKPAGMGMGLAISRSIVKEHGGHLKVVPGTNLGATVSFTLPIDLEKDVADEPTTGNLCD